MNYGSEITDGITQFTDNGLEAPHILLDRVATYNKGVFIGCDGFVLWQPSVGSGTLTWSGDIHIYFTTSDGDSIHNFIAAGSLASIADGNYVYVDLVETDDEELTAAKAAIPNNTTSTQHPFNRLCLGYRNTASDTFSPRALTGVYFPTTYIDIQFPISTGRIPTPSNFPSFETFTTNTEEYAFDVNDYIDLAVNDLSHGWKEGSTGHVHLHITTNDAVAVAEYAKFTVYIAYVQASGIWTETTLTAETPDLDGSSDLESIYLDMGDLTLAGLTVQNQFKMRVKRIAATTGTEYGEDIFINQVGIHVITDYPGSRSEQTK